MNADIEARCADCGSTDLYCGECDPDRLPEKNDRRYHAFVEPRVLDDMRRRKCPCEFNDQWLLCSYHEGMLAGIELLSR